MKKKRLTTIIKKLYEGLVNYLSPSNFTYMWSLESMALICLIIQIVSGLFLSMFYKPDISIAFIVIGYINRELYYGWLVRYIHMNGTLIKILTVYLHMVKHILYGSNSYPRQVLWFSGMLIFFSMMATAFKCYVLPWGQMSLWGVTVVENVTLSCLNNLHFLFPFIILALSIIHSIFLYKLKAKKKEKVKSKVYNGGKKGLKKNINRVQKRKMYRIISYERKKKYINKIQKRRMFRIGIWRNNQNINPTKRMSTGAGGNGDDPNNNRISEMKKGCNVDEVKKFKLYKLQKSKLQEVLEKIKNKYKLDENSLMSIEELMKHKIIRFEVGKGIKNKWYIATHAIKSPYVKNEEGEIEEIETRSLMNFMREDLYMDGENIIELNQLINILKYLKRHMLRKKFKYTKLEKSFVSIKDGKNEANVPKKELSNFKKAEEARNQAKIESDNINDMVNQLEDYILNQMGNLHDNLLECFENNSLSYNEEDVIEIIPWLLEQNVKEVDEYEGNIINSVQDENYQSNIRTSADSVVINRYGEERNLEVLGEILENREEGRSKKYNKYIKRRNIL